MSPLSGLQDLVVHRFERHPVPEFGVLLDALTFPGLNCYHETGGIHKPNSLTSAFQARWRNSGGKLYAWGMAVLMLLYLLSG